MFQIVLKKLREEKKLSQAELAKELNVGASTVSMWENGSNKPEYATLVKICKFFNTSFDVLIGDYDYDLSKSKPDFVSDYYNANDEEKKYLSFKNGKPIAKEDTSLSDKSSQAETQLIENYRNLNPEGQEKLLEYSNDLQYNPKYKKHTAVGKLQKNA